MAELPRLKAAVERRIAAAIPPSGSQVMRPGCRRWIVAGIIKRESQIIDSCGRAAAVIEPALIGEGCALGGDVICVGQHGQRKEQGWEDSLHEERTSIVCTHIMWMDGMNAS